MNPVLTVAVPTYNRLEYLRQTLGLLLPQQASGVEVIVLDNHSTDGTWEYLESLPPEVRRFRHESNIGPEPNILDCITRARGTFIWLLGDDDLPCANSVAAILAAVDAYPATPLIFLRSDWQDSQVSGYRREPVDCLWAQVDRDRLLQDVGVYVTVLSSIVVRRNAVDWPFVRCKVGSLLVPAAIVLSTIGASNSALLSDKPLVVCRGGNSGGYNGLTVFTKNLKRLLNECSRFGFQKKSRDHVYEGSLNVVVPYLLRHWQWGLRDLDHLVRYSAGYRQFYARVLPLLAKTWLRGKSNRSGILGR